MPELEAEIDLDELLATDTATAALQGHLEVPHWERYYRRRAFAPPPKLTVSEWSDAHRILSDGTTSEPGRWRTSRVPYLREIMDAMGDPSIEHIVFMKSARVGATEAINNYLGFIMDQAPANVMLIQPTVEDAKGWSKEQLKPMLRDTPQLQGKVKEMDSGRRDSRDTLQYKEYAGGFLVVMGSNSASGLRRRNIQHVLGDERDGHAASAKGGIAQEGDPFELAIKRTENFPTRTIFEASTPLIKGHSRIERAYERSDKRRHFVPCPHCGHMQELKWKNLQWENNDPETTVYICGEISKDGELTEGCGHAITEDHKPQMVRSGEWRATRPGRRVRGYHIWAAYSLLTSWSRIVDQWLKAQGDVLLLQVFINTALGETWEEGGEGVEPTGLYARREPYATEVPRRVGVLTCGVDVQGDRLEYSVWGWGAGEESYLIKHEQLFGDPHHPDVWERLDLVRGREWAHESGARLKIRAMAVDAHGHHTDEVYRYCMARLKRGVFAVMGSNQPGAVPVKAPSPKSKAKAKVWYLGTESLKDLLYSRIKIDTAGPGYVHFPREVDEEYFRQLTSEMAVTRWVKGRPVRIYILREGLRNEALDCSVYALAALIALGGVRDQLATIVNQVNATGSSGTPAPRRHRRIGTLSKGVDV